MTMSLKTMMMRWTRTVTLCIMIMTGMTMRSAVFTMACHPLPKGTEGADSHNSLMPLVGTEGVERLHLPMSLIAEHAGLSLGGQPCSFRSPSIRFQCIGPMLVRFDISPSMLKTLLDQWSRHQRSCLFFCFTAAEQLQSALEHRRDFICDSEVALSLSFHWQCQLC